MKGLVACILSIPGAQASAPETVDDAFVQTKAKCIIEDPNLPKRSRLDEDSVRPDESRIPDVVTYLVNEDFVPKRPGICGTYIIRKPGIYRFKEDITVDAGLHHSLDPPFHFGCIDALRIESDNVRLDLNGHTLRQEEDFIKTQRFFRLIELGQQPYPRGIVGFVEDIIPSNNVIIENGNLGHNAHHGIHGNGNRRILIRRLHIHEYEIAAITLNNCTNCVIEDVHVDNGAIRVPVFSNFALVWMLNRTCTLILNDRGFSDQIRNQAHQCVNDKDIIDVLENPGEDSLGFGQNPNNDEVEGDLFCIHIAQEFSVGLLGRGIVKAFSENIILKNVTCYNIKGGPFEVRSMYSNGKELLDFRDNRLRYSFCYDDEGVALPSNRLNDFTCRITQLQAWSTHVLVPSQISASVVHALINYRTATAHESNIFPLTGVDSRGGHSPKGVLGLRLDGVKNARVSQCAVHNLQSTENRGFKLWGNKFEHPENPIVWRGKGGGKRIYKGNYAFGFSLSSCEDVDVEDLTITGIWSKAGNAMGVSVIGPSRAISLSNIRVEDISTNKADFAINPPNLPNLYSKNMAFFKEEEVTDIKFRDVNVLVIHTSPSTVCTGVIATDSSYCPVDEPGTEEPQCLELVGWQIPLALAVGTLSLCLCMCLCFTCTLICSCFRRTTEMAPPPRRRHRRH